MIATEKNIITISTTVNAPVQIVWKYWTSPEHIVRWNNASPEWHTPRAENDLRVGGRFTSRMEARDGSAGFDFGGEYTKVETEKEIAYRMDDNRTAHIWFSSDGDKTHIKESFEAENMHSAEMQQAGWQAILDNFKQYVENSTKREKLQFKVSINAPAEKVYNIMLDENTYRQWTAAFDPSSFYKGSWEEGSKILFIGIDKDGKQRGMVSRIRQNKPNEFVSVEHLGLLDGDTEVTSGPEVEGWAGFLENYTFQQDGKQTNVIIDMEANQEFKSYFEQSWPQALQKLKTICEQSS